MSKNKAKEMGAKIQALKMECANLDLWNRRAKAAEERVAKAVSTLDTIHHALHIDHDPNMALLVVRQAIEEQAALAAKEGV